MLAHLQNVQKDHNNMIAITIRHNLCLFHGVFVSSKGLDFLSLRQFCGFFQLLNQFFVRRFLCYPDLLHNIPYGRMSVTDSCPLLKNTSDFTKSGFRKHFSHFHIHKGTSPVICFISNPIIDGIKNKIKVLNRAVYGYRDFHNFKNRILLHFKLKSILIQKILFVSRYNPKKTNSVNQLL